MKKIIALLTVATLSFALLSACSSNDAADDAPESTQTLNLYTWEGMFPEEVLSGFEEETGIEVNYTSFDTGETMLSRLQVSEGGDYDLVIVDDYIIEMVIQEGLAQKLDKTLIPNIVNVNPLYQGQFFDPEDEYSVPHGAGVQTIVYDPSRVDIDINGYEDLWDESLADSVGIIGNYRVINGMALKVLGESYNTNDIATIEEAGDLLVELAPNIRLIKDDNLQGDLLSGEVSVAVMYTSMVTQALMTNPELEVVYPSEGVGFGLMGMFIPSQAPNASAAHQFMDYILRAEVGKPAAEWLGYYSTNIAVDPLFDEATKRLLTLPEEFQDNTEMIQNVSPEADEAHLKAWTAFKTAAGQ